MKKLTLLTLFLGLCACAHTSEQIIGYNEEGKTLVRVCTSRGNLVNASAFGSDCVVELRDYGRVTNKAETVNIISSEKR